MRTPQIQYNLFTLNVLMLAPFGSYASPVEGAGTGARMNTCHRRSGGHGSGIGFRIASEQIFRYIVCLVRLQLLLLLFILGSSRHWTLTLNGQRCLQLIDYILHSRRRRMITEHRTALGEWVEESPKWSQRQRHRCCLEFQRHSCIIVMLALCVNRLRWAARRRM